MACGTTAIWWVTATLQILLHLLETSLQLHSAFTYLTVPYDVANDVNPHVIAYVIIGIIAFSSCVTNLVSAIWTYREMDFTAQRTGGIMCGVLHVLQIGPLWRYFKLLLVGDYRDVDELFKLRILQVCLQDSAYIVMQGVMLLAGSPTKPAQLILGLTVSFISVIFSFTCCSHTVSNTLTFVTNFESRPNSTCLYNRRLCSALKLMCKVLRHIFMLASRLLALVLLAHASRAWVLFLLVGHLLLFYLIFLVWSIVTHDKHTHELSVAKRLPDILLFGIIEVFDFTGRLYKSNKQVCIYYAIILLENTVMGIIWYLTRDNAAHNDMLLVLVFTFFILGVITCVFSEGFIHGPKSSTLDDNREEKKNLDMVESFSVKEHIDNLAVADTGSKPNLNQVTPSDFDLDIKDILFASAYNPNVCKEVTVISNKVLRQSEALSSEAQTSSDSGFVSRLFGEHLENDSEGYNREEATTPSMDSSALPDHTDTKANTDSTDIYQCLFTSDMEHTQSITSVSKTSTGANNNTKVLVHRPRRPSRHRNRTASLPHRPRPAKSWAGHRTHHGGSGYDSESSSGTSSCSDCMAGQQADPHLRYRRRRPHYRSRSVPDNRRQNMYNNINNGLYKNTGLYTTCTSESSTDGAAHSRSRLPRAGKMFPYGSSPSSSSTSGSGSDSFFDSYQRRRSAPYSVGSSSWSDSQSLGDSDFGFTRTWPPGRRCSIVNIYELPSEQISMREHVVSWLRNVEHTQTGQSNATWEPSPSVPRTSRDQPGEGPKHRFDSFRDVKITYIDSYGGDISHMSDTGLIGNTHTDRLCYNTRPRTLSEGGDNPHSSGRFRFCGIKLPRSGTRKKWLDRKIKQRFSFSGNKQKMIIVNKEATYNSNVEMLGLESSV